MPSSSDDLSQQVIQEFQHLLTQSLHKIRHCLSQLDEDQIWWRPAAELNSIGNLILHLCGNLNQWAVAGITGGSDARQRESEFQADRSHHRDELLSLLEQNVQRASEVMQSLSADDLLEPRTIQGFSVSVLGALTHTVPHFVGHTHQIIYLTRQQLGEAYQFDWDPDARRHGVPI
ncbi:DinB family protein [Gimesia panareensis]|uniref:DinB superfamily protein n=1 Tax=Gimesia panareensis TaxID=2527978 RepID=A0A518A083_9PLAN|nr:DinB family protein [Gimesia panareensis]QDT25148.1 DinB superfamily protein [Gimesia panareensis]QDU48113.1 DinB superfamily protein [Gimesia panareensis]